MLLNFFRKRAVTRYAIVLPRALQKRYGVPGRAGFTRAQVTRTVTDLGLSRRHLPLAFLMFCSKDELQAAGYSNDSITRLASVLGSVGAGGYIGLYADADADGGVNHHISVQDHHSGGFHDGGGGHDGGGYY